MAQPFEERVSVERLSTVLDVDYPLPVTETGTELPPDVRPQHKYYASPVPARCDRESEQQGGASYS